MTLDEFYVLTLPVEQLARTGGVTTISEGEAVSSGAVPAGKIKAKSLAARLAEEEQAKAKESKRGRKTR